MNKQILSLNLLASGLLISGMVSASPQTVKDWSLDDTGTSCLAFTSRTIDDQQYRFELSVDKSGAYPVEAWVREISTASGAKAFQLTTEVKPIQSFVFAPIQDAAGNFAYWKVPGKTEELISYIKRQTRLVVHGLTPNGADIPISKTVDFSLRGSSAIVDALVSQCIKGKSLVQTAFEDSFVPVLAVPLDPLKIDEVKTAQLRVIYHNSVVLNAQKAVLQKELTSLNSQYAKLTQELAKVTGSLDQLTQKELVRLQNQKTSIEVQIQNLDQQLANQQALIVGKETEVVTANGIYDQAWKILAPLGPEHKRLNEALQVSRGELKKNQTRLSDIDLAVQANNNSIVNLESEASSLRYQLSRLDIELNNLRIDIQNTDSQYRRFDSGRERDERVWRHPISDYCQQNRTNVCEGLMRGVIDDASDEVSEIGSRLSQNFRWAQDALTQKQSVASQLDSRIRNILQYDIPSLRNQVADLLAQRSSVESSVIRYRDDVNVKAGALQSYEQSTGYAAKKADVDAKAAAVVKLQGELKSLEQAKASMIKNRDQQTKNLASTDKKIQDVLAKIQAGQDRSSELSKALGPYFIEKTRIENETARIDGELQTKKQEFATVLGAI